MLNVDLRRGVVVFTVHCSLFTYIRKMMRCKYLNDKDEADINEKSNSHSIVVLLLSLSIWSPLQIWYEGCCVLCDLGLASPANHHCIAREHSRYWVVKTLTLWHIFKPIIILDVWLESYLVIPINFCSLALRKFMNLFNFHILEKKS